MPDFIFLNLACCRKLWNVKKLPLGLDIPQGVFELAQQILIAEFGRHAPTGRALGCTNFPGRENLPALLTFGEFEWHRASRF